MLFISRACAADNISKVAYGQYWKELHLQCKVPLRVCLGNSQGISPSPRKQHIPCKYGCDRSIMKSAVFGELCTSSSVSVTFPELRSSHLPRMRCKRRKFRCDRSIKNGTLLGGTKYLSVCISASIRRIQLLPHKSHLPRKRYRWCKFSCYQPIMMSTLLGGEGGEVPLRLCLGYSCRVYPEKSYLILYMHAVHPT
jgi:hypothetical protein